MSASGFKLIFITQEDPFYVRIFFEDFLRLYPHPQHIQKVVICPTMAKKSIWQVVKQMYYFYGALNFVCVGILYVWAKLIAVLAKFIPFRKYYSLEQLFRAYSIPMERRSDINSAEFIQQCQEDNIDLIVSVASSIIFKPALITAARCGCINIHHAKLPKYRGMLPNFWQMYNNEKTAGITIHRINDSIDDGEILLQTETPIGSQETLDQLIRRTKKLGAGLMVEVIAKIIDNNIKAIPNRKEESSYYTFPNRQQMQQFRKKGKKVI